MSTFVSYLMTILVCCLFIVPYESAIAGYWGVGTLSNDAALEALHEISGGGGVNEICKIFNRVLNKDNYLDDEQASRGLAATELVAAMLGRPSDKLPSESLKWATQHSKDIDAKLIQLSLKTIEKTLGASETRDLMEEGDPEVFKFWRAGILELKERIRTEDDSIKDKKRSNR